MRYALTDYEWTVVKRMLPNKARGVPRVNDRRILNGIFWVLGSGAPWRDRPQSLQLAANYLAIPAGIDKAVAAS
jgi:transposase